MDLQSLLPCFSVALFVIALWGHLPQIVVARPLPRCLALGLLTGSGAMGSMLLPVHVQAGVIFDLRAPLLATAGVIGGPIAAGIAALLAMLCRIQIGGAGAPIGCASIAVAALLGVIGHQVARRRPQTPFDLPVLALAVSSATFAMISMLLQGHLLDAVRIGGPITLLVFGCTWLFPLSLMRDLRLHVLAAENGIYRAIIERLPDSLNAKDMKHRFVAANPATARLMGAATPAALIGRSDDDFYPAAAARAFKDEERRVLAGSIVGPVDQEVEFADGSRRWLTSMKTPLRDAAGRIHGIITHNRDVTDQKALEAELAKAQGYLQEAMANIADGLVLYDGEGIIRFCNQQYRDLFPATADLRIVGGRFADILRAAAARGEERPIDDVDAWVERRAQALRRPGDRLIDLADGRIIEARSRPIDGSDTLVVFSDVTARKNFETELLRRATHDPLTGLANRAEFEFQLAAARDRATRTREPVGVLMLDLDRFKQVNDTFGHATGDVLLIEVAQRLRNAIRAGDVVARLGGDEFAFLILGAEAELGTQSLAMRVLQGLQKPVRTNGIDLRPGGSIGIALFPRDTCDPLHLVPLADKALYQAKRGGGGTWALATGLDAEAVPAPTEQTAAA